MDKNAIKKYAIWARRELIARVSQKAAQYEVTEDSHENPDAQSVNGRVLSDTERKQRGALIKKIDESSYEHVIEEVAYTWFNRFIALRFMEVNGYLPSRVKVFTDAENNFKPEILAEAIHLEMEGLVKEKVFAFKEANDTEGLYKYLLITQCNELNAVLPRMFEKIDNYTMLLLPDNLLREGSVIEQMISSIPEEDWKDAVQIIGWMYQYYNTEPKDQLINEKKQYKNTDIPFVTQLFTSDWIVRYMVDNSVGRYWIEQHPDTRIRDDLKYYLFNEDDVLKSEGISPEKLTCIDPCMGSGHILVYTFDVLMQIYEDYGYTTRDAVESIVVNNLYGVDIDERASQLAYFAIMMKACQYDKRFLKRGIQPHIYQLISGKTIDKSSIDYFVKDDSKLKEQLLKLLELMNHADEYGSLISTSNIDFELLNSRLLEIEHDINLSKNATLRQIYPLIKSAEVLSRKYKFVISNPPYMANKYMPENLKDYVAKYYKPYKADLFSTFIIRFNEMCQNTGHIGVLTPYVWMFIQSYERLREYICNNMTFSSLVQLEYNAFEAACVPVAAFTFRNMNLEKDFECVRLSEFKGSENQEPKYLYAVQNSDCDYRFTANQENFSKIPGSPIAYWVSDSFTKSFEIGNSISESATPKQGMSTCDVNKFVKLWHEVNLTDTNIHDKNHRDMWIVYNKGGEYRRWYGNREYVVLWHKNGDWLRENNAALRNQDAYFKEFIAWTKLSSSRTGFRDFEEGFLFDGAGGSLFLNDNRLKKYYLGYLNSKICSYTLNVISPTLNYNESHIGALPMIVDENMKAEVEELVTHCIDISKADWNAYETSWDFSRHPLVIEGITTISDAFNAWKEKTDQQAQELASYEQRINEIFIEIYGMQRELDASVKIEDVTIRRADLESDIKSFISYAVGCMLGRYSLDVDGLAYAGGVWDASKYSTFAADKDNIIPISDDEYFEDDIVGRFVKFVEVVYGKDTLQENLKFIADALGGKGQPKDVIRNYFLNGFYTDHCRTYQKRPIYWMFDSGKKNGFKCLIYMHRYQPDTIARIRTDYVHEQQSRYRTAIEELEQHIANASTSERVKLNKKLKTLQEQSAEIHEYEEKIHHLADQMISIDLDDGVKVNYEKFKDVLAKIK